ncbi:MAG: STAS domain-containing protein [Flavobacteriales bacterium]|nr:STAS domain-containing protein [Flavobacteriales bacterium]
MQENENNTNLNVTFDKIDHDILLVKLSGKIIDQATSNELSSRVTTELSNDRNHLILDLSEVDYINSNGLNSLISILTKTRTQGGEMVVFGINEKVQKLLLITKLSSVFTITETFEEAKNQFNQIKQN